MSRFFKTKIHARVLPGIMLDPKFTCPACGSKEKNVVLFCTRCFNLLPRADRADLRTMVLRKQNVKSKMLKCIDYVREKLKLPRDVVKTTGEIKVDPYDFPFWHPECVCAAASPVDCHCEAAHKVQG